jgi:hypothetical protein
MRVMVSLVVLAGCYEPDFADCTVACSDTAECAPGEVCTGAGKCAAPANALACAGDGADDGTIDPGTPPARVAGRYATLLTDRENGCGFGNWVDGTTGTSFDLVVDQVNTTAIAALDGNLALWFDAWLGSHLFAGSIDSAHMVLVLPGSHTTLRADGCSFTYDLVLEAELAGDQLTGDLLYQARTNGAPSCGPLTGCVTRQQLSAIRAPQ